MRKIPILIFLIVSTICSYGQDTLRFTTTLYPYPNVTSVDTISIVDTMYNDGPVTLYGPITFLARVDTTILFDSIEFNSSPNFSSVNDSITSGATQRMTFHISTTNPPFEIGPNTVVIWPIYYNNSNLGLTPGYVGPNDSIHITTYYYPLGIAESPLAKMYIFETPGHLNINFGDAENLVQQVRIYNTLGQRMYADSPDRSKNIQTSGWAMGIYICEIRTFSGETRTFKFRLE